MIVKTQISFDLALIFFLIAASTVLVCVVVTAAYADESIVEPRIEIQQIEVTPKLLWSGGTVDVNAIIINNGNGTAYDLRLAAAVADVEGTEKKWRPASNDYIEPIKSLAPGESVNFRSSVILEGDGWFRVGAAGQAANAMLFPQGQKVHSIVAQISFFNMIALLAANILFLVITVLCYWLLLYKTRNESSPIFSINKLLIVLGIFLLLIGPIFSTIRPYRTSPQSEPQWSLTWMIVLFVLGWLMTGAAFRPGRSYFKGVLLAIMTYFIIGFGITISLSSAFNDNYIGVAPFWPLYVAQLLGLFGLSLQ